MNTVFPLSLSLVLLAGCNRLDQNSVTHAALPPAKVQVASVRNEQLPLVTEVTGTVRPVQRAQLAAKVMGTIEEFPVTLGEAVKSGELLVRISAVEISARVTQAQSQLNAARRDLERERSLLTKGASTADLVHGLEDRFAAAEAMVREAETMQRYTELRAPFDGVIARKLASAGDLASPGIPLLEIEGSADFQIEAAIPESLVGAVRPGVPLRAEVAGIQPFSAPVAEVSSAADPSALTVLAKIAIPTGTLVRSGQFARIQIPGAPVAALMVPQAAVSRLGQMQRVFVVGDGSRAVLRLVKTGSSHAEQVEITAGLDPDERVVIAPSTALKEGQLLEVLP